MCRVGRSGQNALTHLVGPIHLPSKSQAMVAAPVAAHEEAASEPWEAQLFPMPPPPPRTLRLLQDMKPPPPPNPFVVLGERIMEDVDTIEDATAPWRKATSEALQPVTDQLEPLLAAADQIVIKPSQEALQPIVAPMVAGFQTAFAFATGPEAADRLRPYMTWIVPIILVASLLGLVHRKLKGWDSRSRKKVRSNHFGPRGNLGDAEAGGVVPLLAESRMQASTSSMSGKTLTPWGAKNGSPGCGSHMLSGNGGAPPLALPRIAAASAFDPSPLTTARGSARSIGGSSARIGAGAKYGDVNGGSGRSGGRFMPSAAASINASSALTSARGQSPSSMRPTPRSSCQTPRTPGRTGKNLGKMQSEQPMPLSSRPSFASTKLFHQSGPDSARWIDGRLDSTRSEGTLAIGVDIPGRMIRINDLMSSRPKTERGGDHKLQVAFELIPEDWEDPELTDGLTPAERLLSTYLRPVPPPVMPVDEIFFILHSTSISFKDLDEPLEPWVQPWVRNAIRFGTYYLGNNQLRTRDIYGLREQESVFESTTFVVFVPVELNPHLAYDLHITQELFRLGTCERPATEQIISVPIQRANIDESEDEFQE